MWVPVMCSAYMGATLTVTGSKQQAMERGARHAPLASVRRLTDERSYLYELIQTIGAGPDLETILRGVVRLVTDATSCHACFVYFLDGEILSLRAASGMYEHLEAEVRMHVGEGLTGWVARTRRSAFIRENALADPRVRRAAFAELGDDVYQSLVSVPFFARSGDVIGVITLHAEAPHEFGRTDLDLLEHTASLIGGAVENARMYEDTAARVALLTELSHLSQRIASACDVDEVVASVTAGCRDLLSAARCEIYMLDRDERLRLRAASPARPDPPAMDGRAVFGALGDGSRMSSSEGRLLAKTIWGEGSVGVPIAQPLVAGDERLGLLIVLLPASTPDAETTLPALAAYTAVAIKQHQAIEWLTEKNLVKDFFQALVSPEAPADALAVMARRLGCDLDATHLVLHLAPSSGARSGRTDTEGSAAPTGWDEAAGRVESRLAARFPSLLFDRLEGSMRALIPAADASLAALREMDWGRTEDPLAVSVGVSRPCQQASSFAQGFEEAASAAEVGALIRQTPGVTTFEELGSYRYVLASDEGTRDRAQQRLGCLVDYDRRRGTQLLDTLERYLDLRGNVVGTGRALYIHPNTLRQRLERIQRVSGIDLEHDDWLSLAIATKVVKLRKMRSRSEPTKGRGNGG